MTIGSSTTRHETLFYLILTMTVIAISVGGACITVLYQASINTEKENLRELVQSQAHLIESVARFNAQYSQDAHADGAAAATMSQLLDAMEKDTGFGESGEFALGMKQGDNIIYLTKSRFTGQAITIPPGATDVAGAMQRALSGQAGIVVDLDYRGVKVLSAFEPIGALGAGLVAKIDMAEVQKPLYMAGIVASGIGIIVILLGILIFYQVWIGSGALTSGETFGFNDVTPGETAGVSPGIVGLVIALATGLFVLDLSLPLGVASGVLYVALVLLGHWFPERRHIIMLAMLASILTCAGFLLSPERAAEWIVIINRIYGLTAVWITATFLSISKASEIALTAQTGKLKTVSHELSVQKERAEQALLELSETGGQLSALVDTTINAILIIDERGVIQNANPAVEALFGYLPDSLIGKNINILMPEPYRSAHDGYLQRYLVTGEPRIIGIGQELEGQRIDGSVFPIELSVARLDLGTKTRFAGIINDISDRVQADMRFRKTMQFADIGMWNWSIPTGNLKWTERIGPMFGHLPGDLETSYDNFIAAVHPEDRQAVEKAIADCVNESVEYQIEHRVVWPNGSIKWVLERGDVVRDQDGNPVEMLGVVQDITDRKQFEEDLKVAKEQADSASRAKSDFLAVMSHEIRTPMNGVIGMIDVLRQSSLKGHQLEMADLIRDSAFSLLDIIEDILDFSKIEAGKLAVTREPMAIVSVVDNVCAMLDRLAVKSGVLLTLFTDPEIPRLVLGDDQRLRQVLINLGNNAIKFSSKQQHRGEVAVRAQLVGQAGDQVTIEFQITDNGIGMDEATQSQLFTPFTQADASTSRHFGGTGLGLSISRQLAELMGGKITTKSTPNQGSTFSVHLPFTVPPASTADEDAESDVSGLLCLVVGSPESLAADFANYLSNGGATVEQTPDLASARQWALTRPPGPWIWVVDAGIRHLSVEELQAAAGERTDQNESLRAVVIERGERRLPRRVAEGVIVADGNALARRTFLKVVAIAAGRADIESETRSLPGFSKSGISMPSRDEALRQGRLILVAEDNETNQKVILHQLSLLGYVADVSSNGLEALKQWKNGDYALLLSDLQMPEMDGYALSAAIRAEEQEDQHIPIVALTANALAGEEKQCRAVGMDGYLTKPAALEDLKTVLQEWLPAAESRADSNTPATQAVGPVDTLAEGPSTTASVDLSILEGILGVNSQKIRMIQQDFRISALAIAAELRAAHQADCTTAVSEAAHKLKSSANAVGALKLGELSARIEKAGLADRTDLLTDLLSQFEEELSNVVDYLATLA